VEQAWTVHGNPPLRNVRRGDLKLVRAEAQQEAQQAVFAYLGIRKATCGCSPSFSGGGWIFPPRFGEQVDPKNHHLRLQGVAVARAGIDYVVNEWIQKDQPEQQPGAGWRWRRARPSPQNISTEEARKSEFFTSANHQMFASRGGPPKIDEALETEHGEAG